MPKAKTLYDELLANAQPSTKPHPLESVVWAAFAERECHDGSSLGYFLAGAFVRGGAKAYRTVALDVLGYMESHGLLERDQQGWWRNVGKRAGAPARATVKNHQRQRTRLGCGG